MNKKKYINICIIGIGYVGLPLAVQLSNYFSIIAFDKNKKRIKELQNTYDSNNEITRHELKNEKLFFTHNKNDIIKCNVFIVAVPTPVKKNKLPDLALLSNAIKTFSQKLKKDDTIIFESTFYPGLTEEFCIPLIEKHSKLKLNKDFLVGYSPERINPGDKIRKIGNIKKVISGSSPEAEKILTYIYKKSIPAGIHLTKTIKIAEAAKIIENTQRDINIAFINHIKKLFDQMDIDTVEVLKASSTKWNFLNFKPGLVGGHCIGVDPYYLSYKAKQIGYNPNFILSGREINDSMSKYYSYSFLKTIKQKFDKIFNKKILVLGLTFKENCNDLRNSKSEEVIKYLSKYFKKIDISDPYIKNFYINYKNVNFINFNNINFKKYHGILILVSHYKFKNLKKKFDFKKQIIFDIKNII
jgi:UDP-N-acetyl-D-glucosamine/UDP-N-acetyl-D-galactosamine dehydrogenase